ncbi:MAG: UPF0104 family protein [Gemmatimonadales bacterium]|nr:MAG: UPF0104 family protein [Gemmatimonadales bacterium]
MRRDGHPRLGRADPGSREGVTPPRGPTSPDTPDPPEADRTPERGRRLPRGVRWTLQAGATLLLTWVIVRQLGVTLEDALALDRGVPDPDVLLLAGSTLGLLACFWLAARYWGWMVRDLGGPDPGGQASFRIVMTANLGRYLPGKVWQLAGLALLARREGVPAATGTAAGLMVQGFTLLAAGLWGLPALLELALERGEQAGAPGAGLESVGAGRIGMEGIGAGEGAGGFPPEVLVPALATLAVLAVLSVVPGVPRRGFRLLFLLARRDPDEAPSPGPAFGLRWLVLNLLLWAGYGLAFALLLWGLGFQVPVLVSVSAFTAAYLLGYVVLFAPAGIGIREGALVAFLLPYTGGASVAIAVLARVWMTAVELIPAAFMGGWEILRKADPEPAPHDDHDPTP